MVPFVAQIQPVAFNFAPRGWITCDGQLLAISSNTAVFSLIGTTFGGDGRTTFGVPDLRGRSMVGVGSGPGLTHRSWGQRGGANTISITTSHMPQHSHTLFGVDDTGDSRSPAGDVLATSNVGDKNYKKSTNGNTAMNSTSIGSSGGNLPISIDNPYLGIYICMALQGVYPSRS